MKSSRAQRAADTSLRMQYALLAQQRLQNLQFNDEGSKVYGGFVQSAGREWLTSQTKMQSTSIPTGHAIQALEEAGWAFSLLWLTKKAMKSFSKKSHLDIEMQPISRWNCKHAFTR
jgi:hypothetical protein